MRNVCVNILSATDTASHNGSAVPSNQLVSASFQAYFGDDTAAGTFKIQASNDFSISGTQMPSAFTPTNWVDIPNASVSITSGGSALITIANMCYQYVRAIYTSDSGGSSTINVEMNALSI